MRRGIYILSAITLLCSCTFYIGGKKYPAPDDATLSPGGDAILFEYDLLSEDTIPYSKIDVFNAPFNKLKIGNCKSLRDSMIVLTYDTSLGLIYCSGEVFSSRKNCMSDFVEILGKRFFIDSLFRKNPDVSEDDTLEPLFHKGYKFVFKDDFFVALFLYNRFYNSSNPAKDILLIDLAPENKTTAFLLFDNQSEDLKCFNDFNKDGKLDYAHVIDNHNIDTLVYSSLINDRFVEMTDHFLLLYDLDVYSYGVDYSKSNWFKN